MIKRLSIVILIAMLGACSSSMAGKCCKKEGTCSSSNAPTLTEEQMMKAITESATPGAEHKKLEPLIGEWKTVGKFWGKPGAEPDVEKGTASHKWILGKRFIKEEFNGKWTGQPFTGIGILGYDNTKKVYSSVWIDSMGTGIMTNEGTFNESQNSILMSNTFSCPVTGKTKKGKSVTRIIDKNTHVFEMYDLKQDGSEVKMMEVTYTRKGK